MVIKKIKVAAGIIMRKALTGPIEVSVDLTRACNLDCVMCWWRSPLLKNRYPDEWANQELDYSLLKDLVRDFKKLDVKRVTFGGQGEPFLYPRLLRAVETVKDAGIEIALITSGFFLNEENIKSIIDLGVDCIDVSLQSATANTYAKMHPSHGAGTFKRIKDQLIFLHEQKKRYRRKLPMVRIKYVICSLNYKEAVKVVELAEEVGAESIGLKRLDVLPETRGLLLNEGQVGELSGLLGEAKLRASTAGISTSIDDYERYALGGLTLGAYATDLYSRIPCYVGWRSARILADGNVIPCCGCYDLIIGNIRNLSFADVWVSPEYKDFRRRALNIKDDSTLKKECKCHSCIDLVFNLGIYRSLNPVTYREV